METLNQRRDYAIGRLSTVTSPNIVKNFVYDVLGRIVSETKTIDEENYTTAFTYDLTGKPQSMIYPDESVVDYTYNNANFLESIILNNEALVTNFDYAPTLAVSRIDYANGVVTENTFDEEKLYRLTKKLTTKDSEKLQDLNYFFDAVGNITQIDDVSDLQTAKNAVYGYDDLHRLKSATISNTANQADYVRTFDYSITGNILNKSDVGEYAYSAKHPQAVSQAGDESFSYDLNGNLLTDGDFTHTWDFKNRLTSSTSSGMTVDYVYDEGKTRIKKLSSGATTTYVSRYFETKDKINTVHVFANDLKVASVESILPEIVTTSSGSSVCNPPQSGNWNIVEDCDLEGFVQLDGGLTISNQSVLTVKPTAVLEIDFVNQKLSVGSGSRVLVEADGRIRQKTTSGELPATIYQKLAFHHTDHLTGANVETNIEGKVVEVLDYYPYGDTRFDEKERHYENDYKFTGQELDSETDLYYYGARYYDAEIGRFIGVDPWGGNIFNPQTLNKYSYTLNNPLKYVDPTGEEPVSISVGLYYVAAALTAVAASYQLHEALEDVTIPTNWTSNDSTSSSVSVTNPAVDPATGVGSTMTTPSSQVEESNTTSIPTSTVSTPNTTSVPAEEGISLNTTTTPTTENPFSNVTPQVEEKRSLPLYGQPNSTELKWKDGSIEQGRTRDENGNPVRDTDFSDNNRTAPNPHTHEWTKNPDGTYDQTSRSKEHKSLDD